MRDVRIQLSRARRTTRRLRALLHGSALIGCVASCRPAVQPTAAYVGDGTYEGSPPLCLQHREESRPGPWTRSLLVHFTNTCSFAIDCSVYNDVTEQEQRVIVFAKQKASLLVAAASEESRFDVELDCSWQG
jgi:hypothetical protein